MVFLNTIENYKTIDFYNLLRRKDENVITKKDYIKAFLKNPSIFTRNNMCTKHLKAYLLSPKKVEFRKEVQRFLIIDRIIQSVRNIIRKIMTDYHLLIIGIIALILLVEYTHPHKYVHISALLIMGLFGIFPKIFYSVDHFIAILNVTKSVFNGASEFLAKSYLNLTKKKSKNYDFVYFDKDVEDEDINFYERCISELIDIFPMITNYRFNILITDENVNILDESRKMIGTYDSLNFKLYNYHPSAMGLYSPAGATILCKCVCNESLNNLLSTYDSTDFNSESIKYMDNVYNLRRHILYHEFAHMVSININPEFFLSQEFQEAFNKERHLIFFSGDSYFKQDFNEFIVEIIADYLELLVSGEDNISYKDTKTYNMIEYYIKSINLSLKQDARQ